MSELLLDRVADDIVAALESGLPPANEHSRLYEDLGMDSLMLMEFMHLLSERRPALGDLLLPDIVSHMADIGTLTDLLRAATQDTGPQAAQSWGTGDGTGQERAA
ncbi:phosphopantetheine-binding protein [Streptomyces aureocirculatus]|uniref:phosphopantetheine-binding protein n=1 Tax=Streptomyces aureocirculatus TaxID=67275 RepID=UPI0018FE5548|nr:phosphopantetheine-binding protein [Streptomyces aureocirculatus]